ncbi:MAG: hypothetical protein E7355_00905 [Clostridiales bacterium]|nr:hypothetical protein [Clostridiales bacterium]
MIDLKKVENYRENNRIEAKKALGGLPKSIWETYSAFANTLGGIILLGVREEKDKSLHPVKLQNPEQLLEEFWKIINDTNKVSANILTKKHVKIIGEDDSRFIAITVPRASKQDRPIYIGTDPYLGSYQRNGEGDYRCPETTVREMITQSKAKTRDMQPLASATFDFLDEASVEAYRLELFNNKPYSALASFDKQTFLEKLGIIAKDAQGILRPTGAGLLMFGKVDKIKEYYPNFHLRFDERAKSNVDKETNKNVFSFFTITNSRLAQRLNDLDEKAVEAATEALINCLVNADYQAKSGVYITCKKTEIEFSNPGGFRVQVEKAKIGGVSNPRNVGILRLFQYVGHGNGIGSGIPNILSLWGRNGRGVPVIRENARLNRVSVILPFEYNIRKKNSIKSKAGKASLGEEEHRAIIEFLTNRINATVGEISSALRLPSIDVKEILALLMQSGIVTADGNKYKLEDRNNYKIQ